MNPLYQPGTNAMYRLCVFQVACFSESFSQNVREGNLVPPTSQLYSRKKLGTSAQCIAFRCWLEKECIRPAVVVT